MKTLKSSSRKGAFMKSTEVRVKVEDLKRIGLEWMVSLLRSDETEKTICLTVTESTFWPYHWMWTAPTKHPVSFLISKSICEL
jgi:hypothetical protein